jgi:ComEC/Rec2-related protein
MGSKTEAQGRPILGIVGALIIGLTAPLHPINLLLLPLGFFVWRTMGVRLGITGAFLLGIGMAPTPAPSVANQFKFAEQISVDSVPRLYENAVAFETSINGYRVWLRVPSRMRYSYGDTLLVSGVVKPLGPSQGYQALQGVSGFAFAESYELDHTAFWLLQWANYWRWSFIDFAYGALPAKFAAVASALCFNTDKLLDSDFHEGLQRTGTIHIVSVSGLHVVVLSLALLFALSKVPIPRPCQLVLAGMVLSFYALATGLSPPTVRAVMMVGIGFAAYCFRREPDWLSALACSAVLFLLWQPRAVYDIGFQLSFLTVAAFCLYLKPDRAIRESPQREMLAQIKQVAMASFVASAASAPLVVYYFNQLSVVSVFANVMIALPVQAIIVVSLGAHLLSFATPAVGAFAMELLVKHWIGYLYGVLDYLAAPSWSVITVPEFTAYWLVPFYGFGLLAWRSHVRRA